MSSKQPLLQYKSLDDIRARKEELRQSLRQDNQSMKTQWNGLFHQEKSNSPSRRLANFFTIDFTPTVQRVRNKAV